MLIERFTFSKEMIDKFNDYIYKLTEIPYITAEYRKGYILSYRTRRRR